LPEALSGAVMRNLQSDGADGFWLSTSRGVWHRSADGAFEQLTGDAALAGVSWREGGLAVATAEGLWVMAPGLEPRMFLSETPVYGLAVDPGDNLWIQTLHGVWTWAADASEPVPTPWVRRGPLGVGPTFDIHGDVWLADEEGVHDLGPWQSALDAFGHDAVPAFETIALDATPRSMMADHSGQLWVGTVGGGLNRISAQSFVRYKIARDDTGISVGPVAGLGEDIWTAYDCSTLVRFRRAGLQELLPVSPDVDGTGRCIRGLAVFSTGRLAFGWREDVLVQVDDGWLSIELGGSGWIPGEEVTVLQVDLHDRLWIATSQGRVFVRSPDGTVEAVPMPEDVGELWSFEFVGDTVYVGTNDGIVIYRGGGELRRVRAADGLPYGVVRDITAGEDGTIWLVTYGGGLGWMVDGVAGRLGPEVNGMPDGFLSSVVSDDDGGPGADPGALADVHGEVGREGHRSARHPA